MKQLLITLSFLSIISMSGQTPCTSGTAGEYPCNGYDLQSFISLDEMDAHEKEVDVRSELAALQTKYQQATLWYTLQPPSLCEYEFDESIYKKDQTNQDNVI